MKPYILRIGMFDHGGMVVFDHTDQQWACLQEYIPSLTKDMAESYCNVIRALVTPETEYFSHGDINRLCAAIVGMAGSEKE